MKKLILPVVLVLLAISQLKAQPVSDYIYKFDNGINVKSEHCWNQVWVQQAYSDLKAGDQNPLSISTRILGDLTSGSSFKLLKGSKEVKVQGAAPGTYDLKLTLKLSAKSGTLSFVIGNVVIKPKTKTTVNVTVYDYQISIAEVPAPAKGLAGFDSKIQRFKGNTDQANNSATVSFYAKGNHDKSINPDEAATKSSGKIKPGVYDVLISLGISGQQQKIWLENFSMKAGITYNITTNLNGGVILYAGGNRDIKNLHLYPAGTAAKQTGAAAPVKALELMNYENINSNNSCPPGTFDLLLASGNGGKFEWRKNCIITPGTRFNVK